MIRTLEEMPFVGGESSNRTTSSRITSSRTFEGVERDIKDNSGIKGNRNLRENKGNRDKNKIKRYEDEREDDD